MAGAFEDALDTADHLMGLELTDDDPLLADAFEQRGTALQALLKPDEAVLAWERALALYASRRDDAGIVRVARAIVMSLGYRFRFPEAIDAVNRALTRLSSTAAAERASLRAMLSPLVVCVATRHRVGLHRPGGRDRRTNRRPRH